MLANGITGLATATGERIVAGKLKMEVARVLIAEEGRRALVENDGWQGA